MVGRSSSNLRWELVWYLSDCLFCICLFLSIYFSLRVTYIDRHDRELTCEEDMARAGAVADSVENLNVIASDLQSPYSAHCTVDSVPSPV